MIHFAELLDNLATASRSQTHIEVLRLPFSNGNQLFIPVTITDCVHIKALLFMQVSTE